MIILPDIHGWSYDDSVGNWKLVYEDQAVVIYEQTNQPIATQSVLFVGGEQECEAQIELCGLIKPIIAEPILTDDFAGNEETEPVITDDFANNEETEPVIHPADFL
jgi:hypothetical protein